MTKKNLLIHCDGGSRGNPGPAAAAFVVSEKGEVIAQGSRYLGKSTNNVAEYTAVLMALHWVLKNLGEGNTMKFVLDSQLVTKQLTGEFKIKSKDLKPLVVKIKEYEKKIGTQIVYTWSPREKNKEADRLVNEELDKVT